MYGCSYVLGLLHGVAQLCKGLLVLHSCVWVLLVLLMYVWVLLVLHSPSSYTLPVRPSVHASAVP